MVMKKTLLSFVCLAAMAWAAKAQDPAAAGAMTLRECMRYAVSHSTKMRIRQAASDDAQLDRRDAALALFTPQINASTYAYYNFGRSIDPQTNTYFHTTSFHNNYGISAGYDLFNGFQAVNNYRISRTGMQIAASQEKQAEADICLAVMEAYYNTVYSQRLCAVCEEQAAVAEAALNKAQRQEELGQKSHADVIQLEADLADRRYELIQMRNRLADQKMMLADLMFWPVDEDLVLDPTVPVLNAEPLDPDGVAAFALAHDPSMQIASMQELNARRELQTAQWQLLPTLSLYAGWNTSYYSYEGSQTARFRDQLRNNGGEYVELALTFPIWGRLGRQSRVARRQHALDKASAELEQTRREVESEVRRAVRDRDGSAAAYLQAQRKAAVQSEAYRLQLKQMEQGLISPLEFQTARNNYLRAVADELNALFTCLIKQAVVSYYSGIEYIEQ